MTMLKMEQVNCHQRLSVDTLQLEAGHLMGLLGPNGAGKSTLLHAISGDIHYQGQITLHDRELRSWPQRERAKHLGVLPQSSQLSFPFSAEEVVGLGLTPLSLNRREGKLAIKKHMQLTDCLSFADRSYPSLSGGERQRVQLARVLLQLSQATQPPLLLLDEPTSAQDLGQQHRLLQLAQSLCHDRGYGVLVILHDLNHVLRYCDRCCLVSHGAISGYGPPQQLLNTDQVEQHWQYRPESLQSMDGTPVLI